MSFFGKCSKHAWLVHGCFGLCTFFLIAAVFALRHITIHVLSFRMERGIGSKKNQGAYVNDGLLATVPTAANKVIPTQLDWQAT
jgi:hypothetical protein